MDTSAFEGEPRWHWPQTPGEEPEERIPQEPAPRPSASRAGDRGSAGRRRPRHYPPRTCRICFETVLPTFDANPTSIPGVFNPTPSVSYTSPDPKLGRLLRPCKCRGTSRYVHEGCLQAWRHADPSYGQRNFWVCPTCGFRYQMERLQWGRWISSTATQVTLTILILLATVFALGFVGDPIINLWSDPVGTLATPLTGKPLEYTLDDEDFGSWTFHFMKGVASLGLLGAVKFLWAMSPWNLLNLRNSGLLNGGRPATGGRGRMMNISWVMVGMGIGAFLWGVYKLIRAWSRKFLESAGERVMDVRIDGDSDDEDDDNDGDSGAQPGTQEQEPKKDQ